MIKMKLNTQYLMVKDTYLFGCIMRYLITGCFICSIPTSSAITLFLGKREYEELKKHQGLLEELNEMLPEMYGNRKPMRKNNNLAELYNEYKKARKPYVKRSPKFVNPLD